MTVLNQSQDIDFFFFVLCGAKAHTELSVSRTKAEVKSHNAIQASERH